MNLMQGMIIMSDCNRYNLLYFFYYFLLFIQTVLLQHVHIFQTSCSIVSTSIFKRPGETDAIGLIVRRNIHFAFDCTLRSRDRILVGDAAELHRKWVRGPSQIQPRMNSGTRVPVTCVSLLDLARRSDDISTRDCPRDINHVVSAESALQFTSRRQLCTIAPKALRADAEV